MCGEKGTLSALKGSFVNFSVKWENEKEWWSKSAQCLEMIFPSE